MSLNINVAAFHVAPLPPPRNVASRSGFYLPAIIVVGCLQQSPGSDGCGDYLRFVASHQFVCSHNLGSVNSCFALQITPKSCSILFSRKLSLVILFSLSFILKVKNMALGKIVGFQLQSNFVIRGYKLCIFTKYNKFCFNLDYLVIAFRQVRNRAVAGVGSMGPGPMVKMLLQIWYMSHFQQFVQPSSLPNKKFRVRFCIETALLKTFNSFSKFTCTSVTVNLIVIKCNNDMHF